MGENNKRIRQELLKLHSPNIKSIPDDCPSHSCTYLQKKDINELKSEGIKFDPNMHIDFLLLHDLEVIENIMKLM